MVRGLVAVGVELDQLSRALEDVIGEGRRASLVDEQGVVLLGAFFDARDRVELAPVEVPGRSWTVVVAADDEPDLALAWFIAGGGTLAIVAMALLTTVTLRHQRQVARAHARLVQSEQRSRAVQEVAGRLARALSGDDVVAAVLNHLPAAVGAEAAVIAISKGDGGIELHRAGAGAVAPGDRVLQIAGSGSVVENTLVQGAPAWLSSPLAWRGDAVAAALADGGWALALVPLIGDEVLGVLAVSYSKVHLFADEEQALLETVGVLAVRALERGRRYDAEHRAAVAFQRAALPGDLPTVDGLTIAARYRPAAKQATVGGDWYDALVLDARRVVLIVGDVVGHGMVAAAAMGRLRTAFQTIAPLGSDPGGMVQAVNQVAASIPDSLGATVVCVVVDLDDGSMCWCRAGHPLPLVLRQGGSELLDQPGAPPLGVSSGAPPPVHSTHLDEGDRLILYSDGVIERRGESLDDGFRRLGIVAEQLADLDPDDLSSALVEALVPVDEQEDDIVVLVVRLDGDRPGRLSGHGVGRLPGRE